MQVLDHQEEPRTTLRLRTNQVPISAVAVAGESNFAKGKGIEPTRLVPVDQYYWQNTLTSAYVYGVLNLSFTVPSGTTAGTTFLVADNKVIRNAHSDNPTAVSGTYNNRIHDINHALITGSLTLSGATADVKAVPLYIPVIAGSGSKNENEFTTSHWNNIIGRVTNTPDTVIPNANSLGTWVTTATTYNPEDYDPINRAFVFGDIALYIYVATAPADDVTVSLTGKCKISTNEFVV
jgi:hypothetical protein